jgi:hypothetical protein
MGWQHWGIQESFEEEDVVDWCSLEWQPQKIKPKS